MKKRVAKEIESTVNDFYPVLESHFKQFSTLPNAYSEHVFNFTKLESALSVALEFDPRNPDVCSTGINLCEAVLSASTSAAFKNSASALFSSDVKGALSSAIQGVGQASAIQEQVDKLKAKYQTAMSKINPDYKVPPVAVTVTLPSAKDNLEEWKRAVVEPFFKLAPPSNIILFPASSGGPRKVSKSADDALDALLAFIGPSESRNDVLCFEQNSDSSKDCLLVTTGYLCFGVPPKEKKGFFSIAVAGSKLVIPRQDVIGVRYERPGYFDSKKECPIFDFRNNFGVKETRDLYSGFLGVASGFFVMLKSSGLNHERPEAFVAFMKNWIQRG